MQKEVLTENAQARIQNIYYSVAGLSLLGGIAGVVYSNKTGGGFWRGVGYFLLGDIATGVVARVAVLPFTNKIVKEGAVKEENISSGLQIAKIRAAMYEGKSQEWINQQPI